MGDNERNVRIIESHLKTISICGGKIFGGYFRDVIVPLLLDPFNYDLLYKDVDIWFCDITKRDLFIETMGQSIKIKPRINNDKSVYAKLDYKDDTKLLWSTVTFTF